MVVLRSASGVSAAQQQQGPSRAGVVAPLAAPRPLTRCLLASGARATGGALSRRAAMAQLPFLAVGTSLCTATAAASTSPTAVASTSASGTVAEAPSQWRNPADPPTYVTATGRIVAGGGLDAAAEPRSARLAHSLRGPCLQSQHVPRRMAYFVAANATCMHALLVWGRPCRATWRTVAPLLSSPSVGLSVCPRLRERGCRPLLGFASASTPFCSWGPARGSRQSRGGAQARRRAADRRKRRGGVGWRRHRGGAAG